MFRELEVSRFRLSTGIFCPDVSVISDLVLQRFVSNVVADEISDRSKLNCQPRAPSTRCPLSFLCATGNSGSSPNNMDTTRVVSADFGTILFDCRVSTCPR